MKTDSMRMYPGEYPVMFKMEEDYWWYIGIHQFLKSLLQHYVGDAARARRLLDAGCGTGANLLLLGAFGDAVGIDIAPEAMELTRARGIGTNRVLISSAKEPAFQDASFDLAISFDVVCNIADDVAALADLARVLKPGGRLILLMPAYQWLWGMHDVATAHQRRYTARMLREKITRAGLYPERVAYINTTFFPIAAAVRLARKFLGEENKPVHSDLTPLPRPLNALLSALFRLEARVAARVDLPFGLSVFAVARKEILNS